MLECRGHQSIGAKTMNKTVRWSGTWFKGDPTAVYNEIQSIGDSYTPHDILEYAKEHEDSELHKCFEWDDTIAAEKWRVHTARLICCSLKVVVTNTKGKPQEMRIIQSDKSLPAYKPVTFTVRDEDEYSKLLDQAKAELASFKKRYASIVELESVIDEIDRIING